MEATTNNTTTETPAVVNRVTRQMLVDGTPYVPRPGLEYELMPGIYATLNEPFIHLCREWDKIDLEVNMASDSIQSKVAKGEVGRDMYVLSDPDSPLYYMNVLIRKVKLCCQLPEGLNLEEAKISVAMLHRITRDFRNLKMPM